MNPYRKSNPKRKKTSKKRGNSNGQARKGNVKFPKLAPVDPPIKGYCPSCTYLLASGPSYFGDLRSDSGEISITDIKSVATQTDISTIMEKFGEKTENDGAIMLISSDDESDVEVVLTPKRKKTKGNSKDQEQKENVDLPLLIPIDPRVKYCSTPRKNPRLAASPSIHVNVNSDSNEVNIQMKSPRKLKTVATQTEISTIMPRFRNKKEKDDAIMFISSDDESDEVTTNPSGRENEGKFLVPEPTLNSDPNEERVSTTSMQSLPVSISFSEFDNDFCRDILYGYMRTPSIQRVKLPAPDECSSTVREPSPSEEENVNLPELLPIDLTDRRNSQLEPGPSSSGSVSSGSDEIRIIELINVATQTDISMTMDLFGTKLDDFIIAISSDDEADVWEID